MNNKKIPTCLGTVVLVVIAITAGAFVWVYEKGQSVDQPQQFTTIKKAPIKDQQNQTQPTTNTSSDVENVTFCGKTFTTEKILLNGTDVMQRIASFSKDSSNRICENVINNTIGGNLPTSITKQNPADSNYKDGIYFMMVSALEFKIDLNTNNIYILGAFAGEPTLIGKLK